MDKLYYEKHEKNDAIKLVDEFGKEVAKESKELDDQLSVFHRQSLQDFIEWMYIEKGLEIVCRFS